MFYYLCNIKLKVVEIMKKEVIKIYICHPRYLFMDMKQIFGRARKTIFTYVLKKITSFKLKQKEYSFKFPYTHFKSAVFYPCQTVLYVLHTYFANLESLMIQGVNVVIEEDNIEVIISLSHPCILIGKNGTDINLIEKQLTEVFGIPTKINIKEVKNKLQRSYHYYNC